MQIVGKQLVMYCLHSIECLTLVVCGDAKTYLHLQTIKLDYGEEVSWLLPFPGDFHILKMYSQYYLKCTMKWVLKTTSNGKWF